MSRDLASGQRNLLGATFFTHPVIAKPRSMSGMYRHPAPQVGQGESRAAIAAVHRTEDGKQGLMLTDGQQLSITKSPATWGEIASKKFDFSNEWFHVSLDFMMKKIGLPEGMRG